MHIRSKIHPTILKDVNIKRTSSLNISNLDILIEMCPVKRKTLLDIPVYSVIYLKICVRHLEAPYRFGETFSKISLAEWAERAHSASPGLLSLWAREPAHCSLEDCLMPWGEVLHLAPAAISTWFSAPVSEKHIEIDTSEHDKCREHRSKSRRAVGKEAASQSDGEFKRASWLPKQSENHQQW